MRLAAAPMVLGLVLALGACGATPAPAPTVAEETPTVTPTPTPDPAPPALADLVVTPEGLGTLHIGEAPEQDPATDMVAFDDDICVSPEYGIEAGDPQAGGWAPLDIYGDGSGDPTAGLSGRAAFAISVRDDVVTRIDLKDSQIPTDGGVRIGDPVSAVLSAHPDAVVAFSSPASKVYRVTGSAGVLDIEVKVESAELPGYWDPSEVDTVGWIRVSTAGTAAYGVAGTDNTIFGCSYTS
jgi:hypothetical protein